jgi:CDP-diacylglycerol---glycerol-3-phosphate 3-phosphatidyltransferase
MNLPNKITMARIILIPFIIFFDLASSFIPGGKLFATILFIVAVLTDLLDGKIARSRNLVTVLGTFLDSIADKMLVATGLLLIVCDGTIVAPLGAITAIVVICREFLVSALRQLGASKNIIISADMWGKVKATVQFVTVSLFMFVAYLQSLGVYDGWAYKGFVVISYIGLALTVILTIMSCVHYCVGNKQLFKEDNLEQGDGQ